MEKSSYVYCIASYSIVNTKYYTLSDIWSCFNLRESFSLSQLFCICFSSHLAQISLSFRASTSHFLSFLYIYFLPLCTPSSFFSYSLHLFVGVIFLSDLFFSLFLFLSSPLYHIFSCSLPHILIVLFLSESSQVFSSSLPHISRSLCQSHSYFLTPLSFSNFSLSLLVFHSLSLLCVFCIKYSFTAPISLHIHKNSR